MLGAAGSTFADLVKVTVYFTNIDDRPKIKPVRLEFFAEVRPASTLIKVSRLAIPGAKNEVRGCPLVHG